MISAPALVASCGAIWAGGNDRVQIVTEPGAGDRPDDVLRLSPSSPPPPGHG